MKRTPFFRLTLLLLCLTLLLAACDGATPPTSDSTTPPAADDTTAPPASDDTTTPEGETEDLVSYTAFDESGITFTFAAFSDVHNSNKNKAVKLGKLLQSVTKNYEIDALLFAGDVADKINGTANYTADQFATGYKQLSYFAEAVIQNNKYNLPVIWCLGNHEYPAAVTPADIFFYSDLGHYDIAAGTTVLDNAYSIFSKYDTKETFMTATEGAPTGFRHTLLGAYHFFAVEYNYANAETVAWLDEQLALCEAEDPTSPIFVTSHMPSTHNAQSKALTEVLKKHPRVIYISGHSHTPMQNYSSIAVRGGIAETIVGPGDHGSYGTSGPGYTYNSYSMKQAAIFEVDVNGNVRVTAIDFSFDVQEDGSFEKLITTKGNSAQYVVAETPLVLRRAVFALPSDNGTYGLKEDTICSSKDDVNYFAPTLAEDALTLTEAGQHEISFALKKAAATNLIKYYTITLRYADGEEETVMIYDPLAGKQVDLLKVPSDYIMHGSYDAYPDVFRYTVKPCASGGTDVFYRSESYVLSVTAYDDFGTASNTVSVTFSPK